MRSAIGKTLKIALFAQLQFAVPVHQYACLSPHHSNMFRLTSLFSLFLCALVILPAGVSADVYYDYGWLGHAKATTTNDGARVIHAEAKWHAVGNPTEEYLLAYNAPWFGIETRDE